MIAYIFNLAGTDVVHVVLYDGQDGKPLGAG